MHESPYTAVDWRSRCLEISLSDLFFFSLFYLFYFVVVCNLKVKLIKLIEMLFVQFKVSTGFERQLLLRIFILISDFVCSLSCLIDLAILFDLMGNLEYILLNLTSRKTTCCSVVNLYSYCVWEIKKYTVKF